MNLDFLIIGTMKSGTSSLSHYLELHPEIAIPHNEVHYFDRNFHLGNDWYEVQLNKAVTAKTMIIGEKTPNYAWMDNVPEELYKINPNIRLIWLFRNPIERIKSQYQHNVYAGREWLSLENAIAREGKRKRKDLHLGYKMASHYEEQVQRFLRFFPKEQMKLMLFEEFASDPKVKVKECLDFLSVSNLDIPEKSPSNKGTSMKIRQLNYLVASVFGKNNRVFNKVHSWNTKQTKSTVILNSALENMLKQEFRVTSLYLSNEFGLNTGLWGC